MNHRDTVVLARNDVTIAIVADRKRFTSNRAQGAISGG
jgi:hypothetical protein